MNYKKLPLNEIMISPKIKVMSLNMAQMEETQWEYARNGLAELDIVIDSAGYLIEGYYVYLIAKNMGLTHVFVRYEEMEQN